MKQSEADRTLFDRIEFRNAECRLDLMEQYARENIAAGHRLSMRFHRPASPPAPPPLWTPESPSGILFGPDGKPIAGPSSSP
jgi:hypothetical protein